MKYRVEIVVNDEAEKNVVLVFNDLTEAEELIDIVSRQGYVLKVCGVVDDE